MPIFTRVNKRWVAVLVAIFSLTAITGIIWRLSQNNSSSAGPNPSTSLVATSITDRSDKNGLTFEPNDLSPLDFAPSGGFILGHTPEGNTLFRLSDQTISSIYTFSQPILTASISKDEKSVLIQTGLEKSVTWMILNLENSQLQPLTNLIAADWLNESTIIGVNSQHQVIQMKLTGETSALKNQPTIFDGTIVTTETANGFTLISAKRQDNDITMPIYWVIKPNQDLVTVSLTNVIQAHLTPTGDFVVATLTDKDSVQYYQTSNGSTGEINSALTSTSATGTSEAGTVFVSSLAETPKAWHITTLNTNGQSSTKDVVSPVDWTATNFFLSGDDLFVLGTGHLLHTKLSQL